MLYQQKENVETYLHNVKASEIIAVSWVSIELPLPQTTSTNKEHARLLVQDGALVTCSIVAVI